MSRRSYRQACTMARTLDVVGERWTLLLIRELMLGPRRFSDLLGGLPGIGRNLLAQRLRHLENEGLIGHRSLPPPAGSSVYELTEVGWALGPALAELGRWGAERLPPPRRDSVFHPAWAMFPLAYLADIEATAGVRQTYEFRVGDELFHLRVRNGAVTPRNGPAEDPDLTITMDAGTLRALFFEGLDPVAAVGDGRVAIAGSPETFETALAILATASAAQPRNA